MRTFRPMLPRLIGLALCGAAAVSADARAQSGGALRFFGTGVGPPGQQDRVRIPIDDDAPGAASQPCDVGAGSFTIDFWIRGRLQDNATANSGTPGGSEWLDFRWINGNILVDRDIFGPSERDWGISVAGGRVRFGLGRGDSGSWNENTIEGSRSVLTDSWRHVACVRNFAEGRISIFVDGDLDFSGSTNVNQADLSFPDSGVPNQVTPWGPYIVLAAEKHDAGIEYPSFNGFLDEVRVWTRALDAAEIASIRARILVPGSPAASGLVGYFRFEEPTGLIIADSSSSGQTSGLLLSNAPGNGLRVFAAVDPLNTAPVFRCTPDFDGSGAVTVQDIFLFLNSWFLGSPAADIDGGGLDVSDVFAFLNLWFLGC